MRASEERRTTFLRMTKDQFQVVAAMAVMAIVLTQAFILYENNNLAKEGAQSHNALCVYKNNLIKQEAQTQAYLDSDTDGKIFGFPRDTWEKALADQKQVIASLHDLTC